MIISNWLLQVIPTERGEEEGENNVYMYWSWSVLSTKTNNDNKQIEKTRLKLVHIHLSEWWILCQTLIISSNDRHETGVAMNREDVDLLSSIDSWDQGNREISLPQRHDPLITRDQLCSKWTNKIKDISSHLPFITWMQGISYWRWVFRRPDPIYWWSLFPHIRSFFRYLINLFESDWFLMLSHLRCGWAQIFLRM